MHLHIRRVCGPLTPGKVCGKVTSDGRCLCRQIDVDDGPDVRALKIKETTYLEVHIGQRNDVQDEFNKLCKDFKHYLCTSRSYEFDAWCSGFSC